MDSDDEVIVGPNGLPLVDAELDVLRTEFAEWQEHNPGESMPLADYAARFFFAGCAPDTVEAEEEDNNDSLYPDLSKSTLAPAPTVMTGASRRDSSLPVLNRTSASGLPVLERIAADGSAGSRVAQRGLPVSERAAAPVAAAMPTLERISAKASDMPTLERISTKTSGMPALERISGPSRALNHGKTPTVDGAYDADERNLARYNKVEDTATSNYSNDVFTALRTFHNLFKENVDTCIEYKVTFDGDDSGEKTMHELAYDFDIRFQYMDGVRQVAVDIGDFRIVYNLQGAMSYYIRLFDKLDDTGDFDVDDKDAKKQFKRLVKISNSLSGGVVYDRDLEEFDTRAVMEIKVRSARRGVGAPALEHISAGKAMPALERIPTKAAMPALRPIVDNSLPTLERYEDEHGVVSASSIRAMQAQVSSHARATMPEFNMAPARTRSRAVLKTYDSMFDDSSSSDDEDLATGLDASARAALVHSFSTVRDTFARNKASVANDVGATRSGLLSFAAELRDALAAVDANDADRAARVQSRHLSQRTLASIATAPESDTKRAAFVASAEALADLIIDHHDSDAEIREVLVGLRKPDIFVNTMYEAWKRLINQAVKDTRKRDDPTDSYNKMVSVFKPIRKRMKIDERKKPRLTRDRMIVWAAIGVKILDASVDELVAKDDSGDWSSELWRRIYGFRGYEAAEAEGIGQSTSEKARILAEPKIVGKVYRGLKIIADKALKGSGDDQIRGLATDGTAEFVGEYFEGKDRLTKSCFMSAAAGLEILYEVADVRAYDDVYKYYVLQSLSEVREKLQEDVGGQ